MRPAPDAAVRTLRTLPASRAGAAPRRRGARVPRRALGLHRAPHTGPHTGPHTVRAWTLGVCAALCGLALCGAAQANDAVAAAEALFLEGRRAMDGGRYEAACTKFRESHRLEPAVGTVMNLAACEEQLGRLASAWQRWHEALQLLEPTDDRVAFARARITALEGQVPSLTVRLAGGAPARSFFLRNGVRYERGAFDTALPVDPGEQVIVVGAPHHVPRVYRVEVRRGEQRAVEVRPGPVRRPRLDEEPAEQGSSRRTWALLCGSAGLLGASTAVVAGLLIPQRRATIDAHCSGATCDALGSAALEERRQLEVARVIGWIVAGAGVGAGTFLFFSEPEPAPALGAFWGPGRGGVTYTGAF